MIPEKDLLELIIFDLETTSEYKTLNDLREANSRKAELWQTKVNKMFAKNNDILWSDVHEAYESQTALLPEYGRIVCATFLHIIFDSENKTYKTRIKSFYDNVGSSTSEKTLILEPVADMLEKISKTGKNYKLCGHNIKRFDIPFLGKRLMMASIPVPPILQTYGKKPWELNYVDTGDIWSMGVWDQYITLDLMTCSLDLPSPKEFMKGEYVGAAFWKERLFETIHLYCEEDCKAVARIVHKLSYSPYPII